MSRATFLLMLLIAMLLCHSFTGAQGEEGAKKGKTVTNTEKNNNEKITLAKGDRLQAKLVVTDSGFGWGLGKGDSTILVVDSATQPTGKKGTYYLQLLGAKGGTVEQEFVYIKLSEKGKDPAKTFKVTVEVKE